MKSMIAALAVLLVAACGAPSSGGDASAATESARPIGMPFVIERLTEGFSGTAREVVQVAGYTYVAVEASPGETRWTVSLQKEIAEGAPVTVRAFGKKSGFVSKQLDRTFEVLWFGIVTPGEAQ